MLDVADLASVSPGTVPELAAALGVPEREVRRCIQRCYGRGLDVQIIGRRHRWSVYSVRDRRAPQKRKKLPPARTPAPRARSLALYSLPDAAQATAQQAREVMAERVTRDCLRCKTRFCTTRHGPRFCDDCRRYITGLS